jgi:hypothetical protein
VCVPSLWALTNMADFTKLHLRGTVVFVFSTSNFLKHWFGYCEISLGSPCNVCGLMLLLQERVRRDIPDQNVITNTSPVLICYAVTDVWSSRIHTNPLKPSGSFMYHCFCCLEIGHSARNVFLCFIKISEQTAIISLYSINWLVCITETECVYCAVRTGALNIIQ